LYLLTNCTCSFFPRKRPCIYDHGAGLNRGAHAYVHTPYLDIRARVSAHARNCVCTGGASASAEHIHVHDWLAGVVRAGVAIAASTRLITAPPRAAPSTSLSSPALLSRSETQHSDKTQASEIQSKTNTAYKQARRQTKRKISLRFAYAHACSRPPVWIWLALPGCPARPGAPR